MAHIGNSSNNRERLIITNSSNTMFGKSPNVEFEINSKGSITKKTKVDYHQQRLSQSKWAFRLSFLGSIAGFCVIVWSVYKGAKLGDAQWAGIVSGVIVEGVSALFYSLSNKANEKISEFFIELTKDANIENAIKLANEIEGTQTKDELKVKLALYLAGIDEEKICKNTNEICKQNSGDNTNTTT